MFLVGSEIQPSSLESGVQRGGKQEAVNTKRRKAFNYVKYLKEHLDIFKLSWHFHQRDTHHSQRKLVPRKKSKRLEYQVSAKACKQTS